MLKRSGIDTSERKWCVIACNVFEKVFELIRELVTKNDEKRKYMFIVDSMDALCRQIDYDKAFTDSEQVAGGSLIASVFLKKQALPIAMHGHIAIITSQVRIEIPANSYAAKAGPKQKQAGGFAVKHYANYILEFQERNASTDIFYENPEAKKLDEKGNPVGHTCKVIFRKSVNEKTNARVRYPIIYNRTGGNSIWLERELVDMMRLWGYFEQSGAWITFDESTFEQFKDKGLPNKIQGEGRLISLLEENRELSNLLVKDFKKMILK